MKLVLSLVILGVAIIPTQSEPPVRGRPWSSSSNSGGLSAPSSSYGAPSSNYGPPTRSSYGAPAPSYGPPEHTPGNGWGEPEKAAPVKTVVKTVYLKKKRKRRHPALRLPYPKLKVQGPKFRFRGFRINVQRPKVSYRGPSIKWVWPKGWGK